MNKLLLSVLIVLLLLFKGKASDLVEYLEKQPMVENVEITLKNPFFGIGLAVMVRQPLDHRAPSEGYFLQRVLISEIGKTSPVVMVTEGYDAGYAEKPGYLNELCPILEANQVVVEHRYFGKSWPDPVKWEFLNVENAAADHHAIVVLLKPYFTGKWVNTGISKGGQTALLHRMFYPADVDLTVSYVAPMNYGREDGRHEPFISRIPGSKSDRMKVNEFQKEVLRRRTRLMPLFEEFVRKKEYTFRVGLPEIYDFSVLEYSFSFWQWGIDPARIPCPESADSTIFNHWMKVASPDYFSTQGMERTRSFFVQAARELGYYGYKTRPFRKWLTIKSAHGYLARLFLPEDYNPEFDGTCSVVKAQHFLNTTNLPLIFIYGGNDPWTASGVVVPKRDNILKIVQEGGNHRTRISTLDEQNRNQVMKKIRETIGESIPEMVF